MLHYRYHNLVMKIFRNYPSHTTPHISDASVIKKMLFILSEFHDLCQIIYVAKDDMALIPWLARQWDGISITNEFTVSIIFRGDANVRKYSL